MSQSPVSWPGAEPGKRATLHTPTAGHCLEVLNANHQIVLYAIFSSNEDRIRRFVRRIVVRDAACIDGPPTVASVLRLRAQWRAVVQDGFQESEPPPPHQHHPWQHDQQQSQLDLHFEPTQQQLHLPSQQQQQQQQHYQQQRQQQQQQQQQQQRGQARYGRGQHPREGAAEFEAAGAAEAAQWWPVQQAAPAAAFPWQANHQGCGARETGKLHCKSCSSERHLMDQQNTQVTVTSSSSRPFQSYTLQCSLTLHLGRLALVKRFSRWSLERKAAPPAGGPGRCQAERPLAPARADAPFVDSPSRCSISAACGLVASHAGTLL